MTTTGILEVSRVLEAFALTEAAHEKTGGLVWHG